MFWFVLREESGVSFQQHPPSVVVVVVVLYSKLATKRIYWNPSFPLSEWQQRQLLLRLVSAMENYKQLIWSCSGKDEWEWGETLLPAKEHSRVFSPPPPSPPPMFSPLRDSPSSAVKEKREREKGKGAVTMAAADHGIKCSPPCDKNMLLFGDLVMEDNSLLATHPSLSLIFPGTHHCPPR